MYKAYVRPVQFENSNLRAYADVRIGDCMTVRNVKIVEGQNGLFASMPSIAGKEAGTYSPICVIDKDLWPLFNERLIDAYQKALTIQQEETPEMAQDESSDPQVIEDAEATPEPAYEQML